MRTVWHWQDILKWQDEIWGLVSDVLDTRVIEYFYKARPEYLVSDDMSWLDHIVARATGRTLELRKFSLSDRCYGMK